VSLSSEPCLSDKVSSGAATCPMAPGSASPRGELWCCHVPHGPQRAVDHRNKERPSCPRHAARLACFQSTLTRYRDACNTCGHAAIVSFNSATPAQLITHGHYDPTGRHHGAGHVQYSSVMRQDDFTLLTPCKTSLATPSHYDPRYCI
jgi:hypothetical protein